MDYSKSQSLCKETTEQSHSKKEFGIWTQTSDSDFYFATYKLYHYTKYL